MSREEKRGAERDARLVQGAARSRGQLAPVAALSPEEGRLFGCFYRLLQGVLLQRDRTSLGGGVRPTARARLGFSTVIPPQHTTPAHAHAHTRSPQEFLKEKKKIYYRW